MADDADDSKPAPLRCLHYLSEVRYELGGVVRAVVDLATLIASAGHDVSLLTHDATDCPAHWPNPQRDDCGLTVIPRGSLGGHRYGAEALAAMRREIERADVVHLHTPWDPANRVLANLARSMDKPYILTLHGMLDDWSMAQKAFKKKLYLKLVGRRLLEDAAFVHCTAHSEMEQSRKWYPNGTPRILPCVIDLEPYRELPSRDLAAAQFAALSKPGLKVLFLSRIHVKKGVDRLIEACGKLVAQGRDVQVLIAGPGDEPYTTEMRALVARLGLEDRVNFLGMVQGEQKLSLYRAADVFVLPTSQENFGLVLPESLLCETPVVTTFGVDIWRELQEAGSAIVGVEDREALASAIAALDGDQAQRDALGSRGRAYVMDWLDPEETARTCVAMYRDAVDGAGR